jgi:hypothetical protein
MVTAMAVAALAGRVRRGHEFDTGDPVIVLIGSGTSDVFVGTDYQERELDESLWHTLENAGFRHIVFSAPAEAVYALDDSSATFVDSLARATSGDGRVSASAHDQASAAWSFNSPEMHVLNACMHAADTPSAVVILGAEQFLRRISAHRRHVEWFNDWVQARSTFDNVCVLAFTLRSLDDVLDLARSLHMNGLISYLERQASRQTARSVTDIAEPDAAEIERIVQVIRLRDDLKIADWREFDRMATAIAAQRGVLARAWMRRLRGLARAGQPLSLAELRDNDWIETLPSGQPAWDRLCQLIGLENVKEHIDRLRWRAESEAKRHRAGVLSESGSLHMVFTGGPGTGKTTVARLVGELYRELGLLRRGHVHAPEAAELIGMYVGHTAVQTNRAVDAALDGVLFIDEAYRLSEQPGGFGQEAIDSLVTRMGNDRDRLVVVVAGYPDKMEAFLRSNPGLPRRFPRGNIISFPDYNPQELYAILIGMLGDLGLTWEPELEPVLEHVVTAMWKSRDDTFGNAGEMNNLAKELETNWAQRVRADISRPVIAEDVPKEYRERT